MSIGDSIIRIFVGAIIGGVFGAFGMILGIIAVYPIVTGLTSFCPIYKSLGINTRTEDPMESDSLESSNSRFTPAPNHLKKSA